MKFLKTWTLVCGCAAALQAQFPDFTPQTPLVGALLHNDTAAARRLVEQGADPNLGGFLGYPPLILAIQRQDVALVRLLAAKGARFEFRDRTGATPLMWAAFNDTGDSAMVEELLRRGADPLEANKAGETALTWALQRGETPAVAVLRRAASAGTTEIRASAQKAIALLERSGAEFSRNSRCYSCHHQALPQMAFGVARSRGLAVDETSARERIEEAARDLKAVAPQAVRNRDRIPNPPIGISYTLLALAQTNYPPDETTQAMASVIAAWQAEDGAFHSLPPIRPPLESSEVTATALSLRALQLFGDHAGERVVRASTWLAAVQPHTTEDHAMRLLGLAWSKAAPEIVESAAQALLATQRPEGGWAQLTTLESDAYATGQALVALQHAGLPTGSPEYRRAVGFLLRTQFPDGSWLVRSRSFPIQPLKDSGFPHGRHQWISAAGTSWAAMALTLALPPKEEIHERW